MGIGPFGSSGEYYKSLNNDRAQWLKARGYQDLWQQYRATDNLSDDQISAANADQALYGKLLKQWEAEMAAQDPTRLAQTQQATQQHNAALAQQNKIGKGLALGTLGAIGAGAGLSAFGLGGAGEGGIVATLPDPYAGVTPASAGLSGAGGGGAGALDAGLNYTGALAGGAGAGMITLPFGLGTASLSDLLGGASSLAGLAGAFRGAPAAPNYSALAGQQGQQNLQAALQNAQLNRLNEFTPYGSSVYSSTPNPNAPGGYDYSRTITLSPGQQQLYNLQTGNQIAAGGIAKGMQQGVANSVASPFSLSQFKNLGDASSYAGGAQAVGKALYDRLVALRQPQMDRAEKQLDTKLRNQGLVPGTEAYNNAMGDLRQSNSQELNDLSMRATEASGQEQSRLAGLDQSLQQTGIQKYVLGRTQPLAEYNAFQTGTQPTLPQFQPYGYTQTQPVNVMGAAQNQYQAGLNNYNAQSGLYQSLLNFGSNLLGGGR